MSLFNGKVYTYNTSSDSCFNLAILPGKLGNSNNKRVNVLATIEVMQWEVPNYVINPIRHFEWQEASTKMGKSCCAVGCSSHYKKGSGIHLYRFPEGVAEERNG